jgi:hypothetical protein
MKRESRRPDGSTVLLAAFMAGAVAALAVQSVGFWIVTAVIR